MRDMSAKKAALYLLVGPWRESLEDAAAVIGASPAALARWLKGNPEAPAPGSKWAEAPSPAEGDGARGARGPKRAAPKPKVAGKKRAAKPPVEESALWRSIESKRARAALKGSRRRRAPDAGARLF